MFQIVWEFEIEPGRASEFERAYGSEGVWAAFFHEGEGFLGTELFRSLGPRECYITIDRWSSRAAFETFNRTRAREYADIDARCESLTKAERLIAAQEDP